MRRARFVAGFSLALALSALGAPGRGAQDGAVVVEYSYPILTVRISLSTDLQTVLEAICQRTETSCEIAPEAAQVTVLPVVLSGSWAEVIAKMFEGTNLGYAWVTPVPGRPGRLLVLLKSAAMNTSSQTREGSKEENLRMLAQQTEVPEPSSDQYNTPDGTPPKLKGIAAPPDQTSQRSEVAGFDSLVPAKVRAVEQQPDENIPSPAQIEAQEAAAWSIIMGQGANTPASTPGTVTLPVPDPNGNPIVIPTSRQGLTELPFPDPEGRPIPVTPLPRGQSVSTPFPLNPQSTK